MSDDNPLPEILAAMEARLMARINDAQEKLIERMRLNETAVSALTAAVSALTEVARGTNNTLASITAMLSTIASANADLGRRVTDIEKGSH